MIDIQTGGETSSTTTGSAGGEEGSSADVVVVADNIDEGDVDVFLSTPPQVDVH